MTKVDHAVSIPVRRADPAEAEELAPVLTALCRRSKASWGYPADLLARWADELRVDAADIVADTVLVAEAPDGGVLGFARVSVRTDQARLKDLWVEPGAMGVGVGRALWTAATSAARGLGFDELRLVADPNAEAFYQHLGARTIGAAPSEVVDGRSLPLMAVDLRA